jgi:predicted nucleotidyltransferase
MRVRGIHRLSGNTPDSSSPPRTVNVASLVRYDGGMSNAVNLEFDEGGLVALCKRHGIRKLSVFGSVSRGDDDPRSDLDILVEFEQGRPVGLRFVDVQDELAALFGRKVDLNTPAFLSRHFRDQVVAQAVPLYDAA